MDGRRCRGLLVSGQEMQRHTAHLKRAVFGIYMFQRLALEAANYSTCCKYGDVWDPLYPCSYQFLHFVESHTVEYGSG